MLTITDDAVGRMDHIDIPGRAARYLASRYMTAPARPRGYLALGIALDRAVQRWTVGIDAVWNAPGGTVRLHDDVPLADLLADDYATDAESRRPVWQYSGMSDLNRERMMNGAMLPTVTPQMLARAVRVVLGAAHDAHDAVVLCDALGLTRQDLAETRGLS